MKKLFSILSVVIISGAIALGSAPHALAQSRTGVAVANIQEAVNRSNAMVAAQQQVESTYSANIAAHDARAAELQVEVDRMTTQMRDELAKSSPNQARIQQLSQARQGVANAAREELTQLNAPYTRALSYAREQVALRLNEAMGNTMRRLQIDLLLSPQAVLRIESHVNITDAIATDLNVLVTSVSTTPPSDYTPGQILQQANADAAAQATPAASQPGTR